MHLLFSRPLLSSRSKLVVFVWLLETVLCIVGLSHSELSQDRGERHDSHDEQVDEERLIALANRSIHVVLI